MDLDVDIDIDTDVDVDVYKEEWDKMECAKCLRPSTRSDDSGSFSCLSPYVFQ